MKNISLVTVAILLLGANCASETTSYKYMGKDWNGACASGLKQSPIDVPIGQRQLSAAAQASFLAANAGRTLQALTQNVGATCTNNNTAETCGIAGYCCATWNRTVGAAGSSVFTPIYMSGQSYNISGVEYFIQCNYKPSTTALHSTEVPCGANFQCLSNQCCAPRISSMNGALNNYPTKSYCVNKTAVGVQYSTTWAASTGIAATLQVNATCMPDPIFVPLGNLNIISSQSGIIESEVENLTTTVIIPVTDPTRQYFLSLFDETNEWKTYNPLQFHFHSPSEHTFNNKTYDLEMHIVHGVGNSTTSLAVLAVYFDIAAGGNTTNPFLTSIFDGSATTNDTTRKTWVSETVNLQQLVASLDKSKIINYSGSLTTPPCAEIVEWILLNDPQSISAAQLALFSSKWSNNFIFARGNGNNRLTQAHNGRELIYYNTAIKLFAAFTVSISALISLF